MQRPKHAFGWAGPEPFDPRDVRYSVSGSVMAALPPAVDLRPRWQTPPYDQGNIGSCGPNSAAADLLFDQEQTPAPDVMPSRLFIYYATRLLMGTVNQDSGVYNRDLCKALAQYGWPSEASWPYVISKYRTKPTDAAFAEAATRKVVRYEKVSQTLDQMKGALVQGDPFIFGFNWYSSWSGAIDQTGDLTVTSSADQVAGGHDVLICGYDDAIQRFHFRNSWGTSWGNGGFGTIPYAQAVNPSKASDFWTLHWDEAQPPPVPPTPPVPPVPPQPGQKWRVTTTEGVELIVPSPNRPQVNAIGAFQN